MGLIVDGPKNDKIRQKVWGKFLGKSLNKDLLCFSFETCKINRRGPKPSGIGGARRVARHGCDLMFKF